MPSGGTINGELRRGRLIYWKKPNKPLVLSTQRKEQKAIIFPSENGGVYFVMFYVIKANGVIERLSKVIPRQLLLERTWATDQHVAWSGLNDLDLYKG